MLISGEFLSILMKTSGSDQPLQVLVLFVVLQVLHHPGQDSATAILLHPELFQMILWFCRVSFVIYILRDFLLWNFQRIVNFSN